MFYCIHCGRALNVDENGWVIPCQDHEHGGIGWTKPEGDDVTERG